MSYHIDSLMIREQGLIVPELRLLETSQFHDETGFMEAKNSTRKEPDKGKALSFTVPWGRRMIEISSPHVSSRSAKRLLFRPWELIASFVVDAGIRSAHQLQQLRQRSSFVGLNRVCIFYRMSLLTRFSSFLVIAISVASSEMGSLRRTESNGNHSER